MELDNKLWAIILEFTESWEDNTDEPRISGNAAIAQIKQAFLDAGWMQSFSFNGNPIREPQDVWNLLHGEDYRKMTGQEWFDRFKKLTSVMNEIVQLSPELHKSYKKTQQQIQDIYLEAAKNASGIE